MAHPFFMCFVNSFPFPHKLLVHYFWPTFLAIHQNPRQATLCIFCHFFILLLDSLTHALVLSIFCHLFYHFTIFSDPRLGFWVYFATYFILLLYSLIYLQVVKWTPTSACQKSTTMDILWTPSAWWASGGSPKQSPWASLSKRTNRGG